MSIEPINPSDHIQAAMRLAQERHTQAPDDIEASRAATQAVINEQVRADRVRPRVRVLHSEPKATVLSYGADSLRMRPRWVRCPWKTLRLKPPMLRALIWP